MSLRSDTQPVFPCPFCRSSSVNCIGEGTFTHYRCDDCAETWTAVKFPRRTRPHVTTATLRIERRSKTIH